MHSKTTCALWQLINVHVNKSNDNCNLFGLSPG